MIIINEDCALASVLRSESELPGPAERRHIHGCILAAHA